MVSLTAPRWFCLVAVVGVAVSQIANVASWADARFGTIPNLILLAWAAYGAMAWGPFGLRGQYEREVRRSLAHMGSGTRADPIEDADLAALPLPVQRYLRFAGLVGTPRVRAFRARLTGRIRGSSDAPWMPFVAEQHSLFDPPRRYFFMEATRGGLPVHGLHAYGEADASMSIRLLAIVPIIDLRGPDLMSAETVTILNDICLFAPGRLLDAAIRQRHLDARSLQATYTGGPHTVRAVLIFDDSGALRNFRSDDRPALAEDGKTMRPQRWSTPVLEYGSFRSYRLVQRAEGRYAPKSGGYSYIELDVHDVTTEVVPDHRGRP